MSTFAGRTALITGGTRGIGAAIAERLASEGAHVALTYRSADGPAQELLEGLSAKGWSATIHRSDVGDPAACTAVVDEVVADRGGVDFLVNNAGITSNSAVRRMTDEQWDEVIRVNLSGIFHLCRAVLPSMVERGSGRIVNMSSVTGESGIAGGANYAAAKSGLFGFSKSLALEVAHRGITVNAVAAGFIDTELIEFMEGPQLDDLLARIPVRRLGRPEEIARTVSFLLEDEAAYITGAVLAVNGGLHM